MVCQRLKVRDCLCALLFGLVSQVWKNLSEKLSEIILVLYQASITNSFKMSQRLDRKNDSSA